MNKIKHALSPMLGMASSLVWWQNSCCGADGRGRVEGPCTLFPHVPACRAHQSAGGHSVHATTTHCCRDALEGTPSMSALVAKCTNFLMTAVVWPPGDACHRGSSRDRCRCRSRTFVTSQPLTSIVSHNQDLYGVSL
jgi:hypothetical protein